MREKNIAEFFALWYRLPAVHAPVAQLDRVPDFESVGRGFESLRAHHSQIKHLALFELGAFFVCVRICVRLLSSLLKNLHR